MSEKTARCERNRRNLRRARDVCVSCCFPAKGYAYCRPCRIERAAKSKEYYHRKKREKIALTS